MCDVELFFICLFSDHSMEVGSGTLHSSNFLLSPFFFLGLGHTGVGRGRIACFEKWSVKKHSLER